MCFPALRRCGCGPTLVVNKARKRIVRTTTTKIMRDVRRATRAKAAIALSVKGKCATICNRLSRITTTIKSCVTTKRRIKALGSPAGCCDIRKPGLCFRVVGSKTPISPVGFVRWDYVYLSGVGRSGI